VSRAYVFLWSGIVIGVGGQMMLKAGAGAPSFWAQILSPSTIIGLLLYVAATLAYLIAIREIPIAVAFPSIAVSYVVILALGVIVFGESLTIGKVIGTALILGGVWTLNR
jgi:multidrug transporter EmrE-like cation transporter